MTDSELDNLDRRAAALLRRTRLFAVLAGVAWPVTAISAVVSNSVHLGVASVLLSWAWLALRDVQRDLRAARAELADAAERYGS